MPVTRVSLPQEPASSSMIISLDQPLPQISQANSISWGPIADPQVNRRVETLYQECLQANRVACTPSKVHTTHELPLLLYKELLLRPIGLADVGILSERGMSSDNCTEEDVIYNGEDDLMLLEEALENPGSLSHEAYGIWRQEDKRLIGVVHLSFNEDDKKPGKICMINSLFLQKSYEMSHLKTVLLDVVYTRAVQENCREIELSWCREVEADFYVNCNFKAAEMNDAEWEKLTQEEKEEKLTSGIGAATPILDISNETVAAKYREIIQNDLQEMLNTQSDSLEFYIPGFPNPVVVVNRV